MASAIFTKGSKVEVSSDEPGFHGAWYVATLVNIVSATSTKKNKNSKDVNANTLAKKNKNSKDIMFEVRYDTLYQEDDEDELLTEVVDPCFVRPVPPAVDDRDFEVDDVVDVYQRDGWWIGVVKKVIINVGDNDGENSRKYLVGCFEDPTPEVELGKGGLRFHLEWVDSCWKIPPNKKNKNKNKNNNEETCDAEDSKTVRKRKRGRSTMLQAERPNGLQKGSSCSRPPEQHDEASGALNNVIMNTEYQQVWPFIKQSAIWATIESLASYRQPPQKPHFSPLKKVKADYREGLAISHMVTFENLVQKISKIQLTDPVDIIKDSLETLVNLETHGFDVGAVRARLNELLSWNDKVCQLRDMAKKDTEELEKCNEEMNQLEVKIKKLQKMMEQNVTMKNMKNEKVMKFQSNLHLLFKQIIDCELVFKKLAASPL